MKCLLVSLVALAVSVATISSAQQFQAAALCAVSRAECNATLPCCASSTQECRPVAGRADGTFCLPRVEVCYELGASCDEAKPCCGTNSECKAWEGDPLGVQMTGMFCQKEVYEENERCLGAVGFPYVVYRPCAEGLVCRTISGGLWGRFCAPPTAPRRRLAIQ